MTQDGIAGYKIWVGVGLGGALRYAVVQVGTSGSEFVNRRASVRLSLPTISNSFSSLSFFADITAD